METFHAVAQTINVFLWHDYVLYSVLATGVLFTIWSVSGQYRALTHGTAVTLGHYDDPQDPGAINHFQALSTALSGTVGLGNIGGVAIAIALGGPGALFWMWIVGLLGMAVKIVEVTLSMLYRNLDDPENPHGGPMWVAKKAFAQWGPGWSKFGTLMGGFYCVTLLVGMFAGGNMFQAWNVADLSANYFGWSRPVIGAVLSVAVGAVLIGGIKRIGSVTSLLVPIMCLAYVIAGLYVVALNIEEVPSIIAMVLRSAFSPTEATGAFVGGSVGSAMLWGMKRALYSSEVGQGTSAIAHCAAKTDEPVREGMVAGLEPFIDTLVVCTITALVLLSSGVWNRGPDLMFEQPPVISKDDGSTWSTPAELLPPGADESWRDGTAVFMVWLDGHTGESDRWYGRIEIMAGSTYLVLDRLNSDAQPVFRDAGVYQAYAGASLTALAFSQTHDWLGKWLVTVAVWLFALSTIISQGYYGEQGIVYLFGQRAVMGYKLLYCSATFVATLGFMRTDRELDAITTTGTGMVLLASLPITLIFGHKAIAAYHTYITKLKAGEFDTDYHRTRLIDVIGGKFRAS
jgi:alanine or glycine:cation symporter, AGCS family